MPNPSCCVVGDVALDELPGDWVHLGPIDEAVSVGPGGFEVAPAIVASTDGADAVVVGWAPALSPRFGFLCHRLRRPGRPLVAVTDGTAEAHVLALVSGADTALAAPPSSPLVEAVVVAHRRLSSLGAGVGVSAGAATDEVRWGPLAVSVEAHRVTVDGRRVALPPRHVQLLALLVSTPGRPVRRDRLLEDVWGLDFDPETNVVDVTVHRLRSILKAAGTDGVIRTVRGVGYTVGEPA